MIETASLSYRRKWRNYLLGSGAITCEVMAASSSSCNSACAEGRIDGRRKDEHIRGATAQLAADASRQPTRTRHGGRSVGEAYQLHRDGAGEPEPGDGNYPCDSTRRPVARTQPSATRGRLCAVI